MNPSRWLLWVIVLMAAGPSWAAPHKIRVNDPALARSLVEQGGKLVADYSSFQIIETDQTPALKSDDARVQSADYLNRIQLQAKSFDTRAPAAQSLRIEAGVFAGRHLHLVQFTGPIKPEWHDALARTGVKIVCYVPNDAYLVSVDAPALARAQAWAGKESSVQWEGPYLADYKVHPGARSVDEKGNRRSVGTDLFTVQLVADSEANPATLRLIDEWKLAPVRSQYDISGYHNVVVSLPEARLSDIAAQPDVVCIQPYFEPRKLDERQAQIVAGNLSTNVPEGPGYLAWLAGKGFTQAQFDASGFVVDVSDSGIDNGTLRPGHFGLYRLGNPSGGSRVVYSRLEGVAPPSGLQGCDGHGTLNAHVIAGYDDLTNFPYADSEGYRYGLGVCPFVKVGVSVIFSPDLFQDVFTIPSPVTLQTHAYKSGARISNNSWGAPGPGVYDAEAQSYDRLVRDVEVAGGNRQMVIVFAAGNDGPSANTIGSPGTAKNVITVGAADNVRSLSTTNGGSDPSGLDRCNEGDIKADSANEVVDFSSRGPCADGRMKPDLVAPGTHVTGGVAQDGAPTTSGTGSALACFDASGVCAVYGGGGAGNPNNFFPLGQQFYTVSSGTSHAAPAVCGACALIRQYFINNQLAVPSPAMTKAYLMNSARYMTGTGTNDTLWSPVQGMGEMNLGAAFDGAPRVLRDQASKDTFTAAGQTRTFAGTVADPTKPFRVTLAWTDAPGSIAVGRSLVNDLDLTVTVGGQTYKGNVFNGADSVAGGTNDSLNNVESVFLPAGATGPFTVTVTAANVAADGLVSGGSVLRQDFALVICNAVTPVPAFVPASGSYSGLFSESNGVRFLSSGAFQATTTSRGAFSGRLQMGARRYSFSGQFDASGATTRVVQRKGTNALAIQLQVDPVDNRRITGSVSDETWVAQILADRAVFNTRTNPAPSAGKYTLIIPGGGDPANTASPQGDGWGAVTVDSSGRVKLSGALGDATKLSQSALVSQDGRWPCYVSLYGGQGQVLGWMTLPDPGNLGGAVSWIKEPIQKARFYRGGFEIDTNVLGSGYEAPSHSGSPVLGFSAGVVTLTGGNLAADLRNTVSVNADNKVVNQSGNRLTMTLNTSRGLFKGSVANPATRKSIGFSGAILQGANFGSGCFLGTDQSGRVFFGP